MINRMSDIKAAAERLRTKWDSTSKTIRTDGRFYMDYVRDLCIIADAYLASHPADSDEPITEEWLRGLGFVEQPQSKWFVLKHLVIFEANFLGTYRAVAFCGDIQHSIIVKTRRDVLRLLEALGIKEPTR